MDPVHDSGLQALRIPDEQYSLVTPCLHVALYTDTDLPHIAGQVLQVYERYLALCPPGRLRWYSTENMTQHKAATPRSFNMLRTWLKADAPARKELHIQFKDGADQVDTPAWSFVVDGVGPGGFRYGIRTNMISCSFPADPSQDAIAAFSEFARWLFELCPFRWGYAGYALQMSPYKRMAAHAAAWRLSMQHPGVEIVTATTDIIRVRKDGIKNVSWFTMLGPDFVEKLGGAATLQQKLPPGVVLRPVGSGVTVRTAQAPELGHVNRQDFLPAYRAVYKVLEPLQKPIVRGFTSFSLMGSDAKEKTTAWLRRFAAEDHV